MDRSGGSQGAGFARCKECGALFQGSSGREFCADCEKEREKRWELIRRFLDEHPASTVDVIAEETGVSAKEIIRFLREGRLIPSEESQIAYACDLCGKPISTGRYCSDCKSKMADMLENLVESMSSGSKVKKQAEEVVRKIRMHTADFGKK